MNRAVIVAAVFLLVTGCGTTLNILAQDSNPRDFWEPPTIYGGLLIDWHLVDDPPHGAPGGPIMYFDMPFSFIGDTVTLPIVLIMKLVNYLRADPLYTLVFSNVNSRMRSSIGAELKRQRTFISSVNTLFKRRKTYKVEVGSSLDSTELAKRITELSGLNLRFIGVEGDALRFEHMPK